MNNINTGYKPEVYSHIFQSAPLGIVIVSPDGNI